MVETKDAGPIVGYTSELIDAIKWGNADGSYGSVFTLQPSVYTVVEFLATQIAQVRAVVYQKNDEDDRAELGDSDLQRLLKRPAPGLTGRRWMHGLVADRCLFGNHYSEMVDAGERALLPLPPYGVIPRGGTLVQASSYDLQLGSRPPRVIASDNMVHVRTYNPQDLRIGVSPLAALRQILRNEQEALVADADMWANGARVGGWIERDASLPAYTEDQEKQFRAAWQNAHAGRGNSSKTAVLHGSKFHEATWSPREAEFIEGRRLTLETVCRAYNVQPSILGLTNTATFASQKEFHRQLYVDTLGPLFREIEDELNQTLVPWFYGEGSGVYIEFNVEEKMRLSFEEQAASYRQAAGVPYLAVNEIRALQNQPRIDDPAFDTPAKPANVNYAGQPGEAPMPEERPLRAVE
jgi:HK97 family phage portal protein